MPYGIGGFGQFLKNLFGSVEKSGLQKILSEFVLGLHSLFGWKIGAEQKVLVHTDGTFRFSATSEKVAQCKMQVGRFRIQSDNFNKRIDSLVGLFIQEKVQSLEISFWKAA